MFTMRMSGRGPEGRAWQCDICDSSVAACKKRKERLTQGCDDEWMNQSRNHLGDDSDESDDSESLGVRH